MTGRGVLAGGGAPTAAAIIRTFGTHIFDMLFGHNEKGEIKPQMVVEQAMKEAGFNVQMQQRDWGAVLARRVRKEGWSMFPVFSNGADMMNPLTHFYVSGTCGDFPGWSCDERIPGLLADFTRADGMEARRRVAADIQKLAYELTPSVMWGQFSRPAGCRNTLKNFIESSYPMFWQVEKA